MLLYLRSIEPSSRIPYPIRPNFRHSSPLYAASLQLSRYCSNCYGVSGTYMSSFCSKFAWKHCCSEMPQPRKSTLVLREAGRKSAKAKKSRRALEGEGEGEISDSAPSEAEFSEPEDDFLGQPSDGWKEAEHRLRGYSKHTAGNAAQSRCCGRQREEKQSLDRYIYS